MLIDDFLPQYDFSNIHSIEINAPAETVYSSIHELDLSKSLIIRTLFRLRGMPASSITFEGLQKIRFVLLGEKHNRELVLGIIGRFWTPTGELQKFSPIDFVSFNKPGLAKAAWNFSLSQLESSTMRITTETRILCLDSTCKKKFGRYWRVIGPFSGLIRKEMLRIIRNKAESE